MSAAADRVAVELTTLAAMSDAALRAEWERVHQAPAPAGFTADLLRRGLAYRVQEKAFGGLSARVRRELGRERGAVAAAMAPTLRIKPGTQLVRDWGGSTHHVLVLGDKQYSYRDQRFASLSAIARLITGAQWSGPRFFGLNGKRAGQAAGAEQARG